MSNWRNTSLLSSQKKLKSRSIRKSLKTRTVTLMNSSRTLRNGEMLGWAQPNSSPRSAWSTLASTITKQTRSRRSSTTFGSSPKEVLGGFLTPWIDLTIEFVSELSALSHKLIMHNIKEDNKIIKDLTESNDYLGKEAYIRNNEKGTRFTLYFI